MKFIDEIKDELTHLLDVKSSMLTSQFMEELKKYKPRPMKIIIGDKPAVLVDGEFYHSKFKNVLQCLSLSIPVFMVGDAGSGKTTIAEQCAAALNLPYYCLSVCSQTSEVAFMGYRNASGNYVRTLFREAYEYGGIFLVDEIDNGNPNVISVINAALSNDVCSFPDAMVKKHPDFRLLASGNTIGRGADRKYVGRLEMDLATLDRFCLIVIDYDEEIEGKVALTQVAARVSDLRKVIHAKKIRLIVSPRASINISKLMMNGVSYKDALDMCVFKGCDRSIIEQIPTHLLELDLGSEPLLFAPCPPPCPA